MKIVVDTNILFSILIKLNGKTSELFNLLSLKNIFFIAEKTLAELVKHHNKIIKFSKLSLQEILLHKHTLLNRNEIIYGKILPSNAVVSAYDLVKDIDIDDIAFVATTIHLNAILWTGDKPLFSGLRAKGFQSVYDSPAIQTLLL
jgi:predicted nucleic acid-binding protein